MSRPERESASGDLEVLNVISEETRGNLIQDILGHPKASPSFDELVHLNPSKGRTTIRDHLDTLTEHDIIEKIKLPEDQRARDRPYTFYTITEQGYDLLDSHNIFVDEVNEIREDYEKVRKPDRIKNWEKSPRPSEAEERLALIASET